MALWNVQSTLTFMRGIVTVGVWEFAMNATARPDIMDLRRNVIGESTSVRKDSRHASITISTTRRPPSTRWSVASPSKHSGSGFRITAMHRLHGHIRTTFPELKQLKLKLIKAQGWWGAISTLKFHNPITSFNKQNVYQVDKSKRKYRRAPQPIFKITALKKLKSFP